LNTAFFLGANTPGGFYSYYNDWLDLSRVRRFYIIKGTPGNGKSSFMRRVAKKLGERGFGCESILCSADPSSLDGVYFPTLGVAFADGVPPHVLEPKYPLAVECYLPLTQFADDGAVAEKRGAVTRLRDGITLDYARLSRVLSAVKNLQDEQRLTAAVPETAGTIRRRAHGVISREIRKGTGGLLHKRFLDALTPDGVITLWDTVGALADRVYELKDRWRMAHIMLEPILEAALAAGQDVYVCYDTYSPSSRIKHLILPGLRLAFVSSEYPGKPFRRIRLDAAVPKEVIERHRLRLRFLRKTERCLTEDAQGILEGITDKHRRLEDVYNPHVDFAGVKALADAYAETVL
jgi:hypothetical protein